MSHSEHPTTEELKLMLTGTGDEDSARRIGEHVHECPECLAKLESLTAKTEFWQRAPQVLRDVHASHGLSSAGDLAGGTMEILQKTAAVKQASDSTPKALDLDSEIRDEVEENEEVDADLHFALPAILDEPSHPEMLGRIGKYDVERVVGCGGMGVVLKAHDFELNRPLAIKVLAPHLASNGTARQRFAQEARAAAGVLHPNVIAVHGVSNQGKTPYIIMPFVSGPSLQALVDKHGPLSEMEIARIALQIASGLSAAHSQGLVHRDIKPANILLEPEVNRVLITDFGLARAEDDASLTRTGWLTGTPNYMSPEQARGGRPDQRSDLFSLGSCIYFLATGRLPFRAETPLGVINRIQNDEPTPVREVNREISSTLADIITLLLMKAPDERFQTAADLHEVLERHLAYLHQPDISKPPTVIDRPKKSFVSQMMSSYWARGVAAAILLGAGAAFFWGPSSDGDNGRSARMVKEPSEDLISAYANLGPLENGQDETPMRFSAVNMDEFVRRRIRDLRASSLNASNRGDLDSAEAFARNATDISNNASDIQFLSELDSQVRGLVAAARQATSNEDYELAGTLAQKAQSLSPKDPEAAFQLAYSLHMRGNYQEAIEQHVIALKSEQHRALALYNLGCSFAKKNMRMNALSYVRQAIDEGLLGNISANYIQQDPDLADFRDDPEFQQLFASLQHCQGTQQNSSANYAFNINRNVDIVLPQDRVNVLASGEKLAVQGEFELDIEKKKKSTLVAYCQLAPGSSAKVRVEALCDVKSKEDASTGSANTFEIVRSPGKLVCKPIEEKNACPTDPSVCGDFNFVSDPAYAQKLKRVGALSTPTALFHCWWRLGSTDESQLIDQLRFYDRLPLSDGVKDVLLATSVQPGLIKEYMESKISISDNLALILCRVSPTRITEYENYELSTKEYEKYVRCDIPASLIAAYLKLGLEPDDYEHQIVHRINPSLIKEYGDAELSLRKYRKLLDLRVPAELIAKYRDKGLDPNRYSEFLKQHVTPDLLKSYIHKELSPNRYPALIQRRIPAALVINYMEKDLSLNKYLDLLQNRVPASTVEQYEEAGFSPAKYQKYIIAKVPTYLLTSYRNAGFEPLGFEEFVINRVSPDLLKRYDESGKNIYEHVDRIIKGLPPAVPSEKKPPRF